MQDVLGLPPRARTARTAPGSAAPAPAGPAGSALGGGAFPQRNSATCRPRGGPGRSARSPGRGCSGGMCRRGDICPWRPAAACSARFSPLLAQGEQERPAVSSQSEQHRTCPFQGNYRQERSESRGCLPWRKAVLGGGLTAAFQ